MLPAEIILIIVGFACISLSFFVTSKNKKKNGDGEVRGEEIWTKKDEEVIIKHVDEILGERGMELVDTSEDELNRICNEKIMAIDEFSKPVLDKIKVNHEEVVFMYNMLMEKKKEILQDSMADTVERSVPVINRVDAQGYDEVEVHKIPATNAETGLKRAKKSAGGQIVKKPEPKPAPKKQVFTTEKKPIKKTALETLSKNPGELPKQLYERANKAEAQAMIEAEKTVQKAHAAEAAEIPTPAVIEEEHEEIADFSRRPSRESVMKSISDTSTTKSNEEVEDRIRQMYKAGKSVIDISKELNIGQGEVKLMIALLKKRS